jgi:hypothetical protein
MAAVPSGPSLDSTPPLFAITHSLLVTLNTAVQRYRSITDFPVQRCTRIRTPLWPLVVSSNGYQHRNYNSLIKSHTPNLTHEESFPLTPKVFNSHDQLFSSYEPSTVVSNRELSSKRALVSPINPLPDTRETLQLLCHC